MQNAEPGWGRRHFVIKFCLKKKKYLIKDLGEGSGTFIQIDKSYVIKNNTIISFAETHFAIILPPLNEKEKPYSLYFSIFVFRYVIIKFLEGPKMNEIL